MSRRPALQIERAAMADLDDLVALELACFDPPWSRASLADSLWTDAGRKTLIGRNDKGAVAYIAFQRVLEDCELLRLAVLAQWRGKGYGAALLSAGLAALAAEGVSRCFLEVGAGNGPALRLYRRFGFEQTGRRNAYYRDGSDALLLNLEPLGHTTVTRP